jgi:hypothetical protein
MVAHILYKEVTLVSSIKATWAVCKQNEQSPCGPLWLNFSLLC